MAMASLSDLEMKVLISALKDKISFLTFFHQVNRNIDIKQWIEEEKDYLIVIVTKLECP